MTNFVVFAIFAVVLKIIGADGQTPFATTCGGEYELSFFSNLISLNLVEPMKNPCEGYGGFLVKIKSAEIQQAIVQAVSIAKYYIGGYDKDGDNVFQWNDGTKVPSRGEDGYQKWDTAGSNQPNDGNERCMIIGEHGRMNWFDTHCNGKRGYICQRGSNHVMTMTNTTTTATCRSAATSVQWKINSTVVQSTDTSLVYQTVNSDDSVATLNFANLNITEAGIYTCVSTSKHCSVQKTVRVTADGTPTISSLTNNTCNSGLLVTWTPSRAAVGFPHKITTNDKELFVTPEKYEVQETKLDGLHPVTNYEIKIVACFAEKLCSTGFQVQQSADTDGVTKPVSKVALSKINNEICVASWESSGPSATYTLQVNCTTDKFRSSTDKQSIANKTTGILPTNFSFTPPPNRRCKIAIQAKGCGRISTSVAASGVCVTPPKGPEYIDPPVVQDILNGTSKTIRIAKPSEDNGLISCMFVILCHGDCRNYPYTLNDLIEANGTNVAEKGDTIAAAIAMPINGSSNISLEFSRGDVTCCNVYNTGLGNVTTRSTYGTICGKAKISDTFTAVKVFVITSTPSESAILLKSSEVRILVAEKTTTSLLTTIEQTTPSPKETTASNTSTKDNNNQISDNLPTWIAGPIAGVVVLIIIAVIAAVVIRRRKNQWRNIDGEAEPQVRFSPNQIPSQHGEKNAIQNPNNEEIPYENARRDRLPPPEENTGPKISVAGLESSYNAKRENNNAGFTKEYNDILQEVGKITKTTEVASTPALVKMNRYKNILPYDENRVPLKSGNGYIYASYINGFRQSNRYIATQGPLKSTVADFWMMAMEQNSHVIVMLTKEYDAGKKKCEKYWPDFGKSFNFSNGLTVECRLETTCNSYIERTICIHNKNDGKSLVTCQYQFMKWPDHGVPQTTSNLMRMHRIVFNKLKELKSESPVIIHCSAGAGRTGAFIAFDILLNESQATGSVNVQEAVLNLRKQRIQMVQNCDQYALVYKLLVEAHIFGDYDYSTNEIKRKVASIATDDDNRDLQAEFNQLSLMEPMKNCRSVGQKHNNVFNLDSKAIPYDYSLVTVSMNQNETEPPFINASYVEAYDSSTKLIAAQAPSDKDVEVFWRAVLEKNVTIIVMLNQIGEGSKISCAQYWPEVTGKPKSWGDVTVVCSSEKSEGSVIQRSLQATKNGFEKTVTQLHFTAWNEKSCPDQGKEVIELTSKMQKCYLTAKGTALVHCSDGIGRTGAFCAIVNLIDRMKWENQIDVFRTVKNLRDGRPRMVKTLDQYKFCYEAICDYLKSFDLYANF